jgi:hypothetical protein
MDRVTAAGFDIIQGLKLKELNVDETVNLQERRDGRIVGGVSQSP